MKQLTGNLELGKIPPQAVEVEEVVLGACLFGGEGLNDIGFLQPEHFYKEAHQEIFAAIRDLMKKNEPVDIMTVTQELRGKGKLEVVGGPFYVSQLTNRVGSDTNLDFHSKILIEKFMARDTIRICSESMQKAYDDTEDIFEVMDDATKGFESLMVNSVEKQAMSMKEANPQAISEIIKLSEFKEQGILPGVLTGVEDFDNKTGSFQKGDLTVLAARPGMGKTSFALCAARNAVKNKKKTLMVTLEMNERAMAKRLNAMELNIPVEALMKTGPTGEQLDVVIRNSEGIEELPLYLLYGLFELGAIVSAMKVAIRKFGVEFIIVDYLQLVRCNAYKNNREQAIAEVSRTLKEVAVVYDIPIVALSQLNRGVENRSVPRPRLSDLRESGAIEQDADMVVFIFRPECYKIETVDVGDMRGIGTKGLAELIIEKHRNGACSTALSTFQAETNKFVDFINQTEKVEDLFEDPTDLTTDTPF